MSTQLGEGWTESVHPDDLDRCLRTYREALQYRASFQMVYRLRRADGPYRHVLDLANPYVDRRGEFAGYVGTCYDVTDQKVAEQQLQDSELKFRSVVESAYNAIITADHRGIILSWNASAAKLFGYTAAEAIGQPLTILMPERYRARHTAALERIQPGRPSQLVERTLELHGVRKDGTEFPLELSLAAWSADTVFCFSGIIRDISDRKAAEALQQKAQDELERRVRERTAALERANAQLNEKVEELERFHDVVVGRELKMMELEREVQLLRKHSGH
jgi:PAS domain S-box-containing protein